MAHYMFDRIVRINCGDMPAQQALSLFSSDCNYEAEVTRIVRGSTCIMKNTQVHKLSGFYTVGGVLKARTDICSGYDIAIEDIVEVTRRPVIGG